MLVLTLLPMSGSYCQRNSLYVGFAPTRGCSLLRFLVRFPKASTSFASACSELVVLLHTAFVIYS